MDEHIVITMERHGPGNPPPVYSLTIFGSGEVVYNGIENVKIKGTQRTHISENSFEELVHEFINIYYFALKDRYGESDTSNQPYVATSITMDGKTKRVYHYYRSPAPLGLSVLEDKIDKMTNSNLWTGLST